MSITNLDKICAEYGMELLAFPKKLYEETYKILQECNTKNDFNDKNYNDSQWSEDLKAFRNYQLVDPLEDLRRRLNNISFDNIKDNPPLLNSSNYETEITKALGILVEDGPFAYMIWLKSQDKEPRRAMLIQTARILAKLKITENIDVNEDLKKKIEDEFLKLSRDLSILLLAKTILEKMLIYARYKAKAMQHE